MRTRGSFGRALLVLVALGLGLLGWYAGFLQTGGRPPARKLLPVVAEDAGRVFRPSDWHWLQRYFPYWQADPRAHLEALEQARHLRSLKAGQSEQRVWQLAGPTNIGGRIVDIEFNPVNPEIVYAAAATGGVFKSTDGGLTWFPVFDEQAVLPIGDIAVDPVNPLVIYVGTGEANGGHNNLPGGGVFKSSDGGATWQLMGLEQTVSIGRILVDPRNPQRVFVAAVGSYFAPTPERGVYRSTDGGATWSQVLFVSDSTGAIDLVMDPAHPDTLLAAMWERVRRPTTAHLFGKTSGIYRSFDGGNSWQPLGTANGLPDPNTTNVGRIGLAMCPAQPQVIYALYNDGANYLGLFKTTNYGDSWVNADPDGDVGVGTSGFSWYFGQVRVHPLHPDTLFVLDVALMRSTDGGATWSYNFGGNSLHVDHHALAFEPGNPIRLIEGNDGGINISNDGGITWTKVAELPVTQFYEIGLDASNPQRLYGGTQDNGTVRTLSGAVNDWQEILGGDGFYVIVHPTNPNIIYAESQFGVLRKSTNGGLSWIPALNGIHGGEPTNWSTPVVMDPNNPDVLYYGTNRLYRTTDGATSWFPISSKLTTTPPGNRLGTLTTIAVAPTNSAVIYVGTDDANVWVTRDTGATWTSISSGLPRRWVTRVAVDPAADSVAYVTFSGLKWHDPQPHVFRTTNFGQSWQDISANLPDAPINAIAIDPLDPDVIYVGTDVGPFVSTDAGGSWQALGVGIPAVSVYDLKIHPTQHYLAAGTHGRSMYVLYDLPTSLTPPSTPPVADAYTLLPNYPNPFNPETVVPFRLGSRSEVSLAVYNALGQRVTTLFRGTLAAGRHEVRWNGTDRWGQPVPSGVYFARLVIKAHHVVRQSRPMVLVR